MTEFKEKAKEVRGSLSMITAHYCEQCPECLGSCQVIEKALIEADRKAEIRGYEKALEDAAERTKRFAGIPMNKRPIGQMTTWGMANSIAKAILSLKPPRPLEEKR